MSILFMQEYENKRLSERGKIKPKWEYGEYPHYDQALDAAERLGYNEHKVQIRRIMGEDGMKFLIEPYEENCGCAQVMQYKG